MTNRKIAVVICIVLAAATILSACGRATEIPYSDAEWTWTLADVKAAEGKETETYKSVYGGETYVFKKSFFDYEGEIKYMFDEDGNLASVAWAYSTDDKDEITELYNLINNREIKFNGKSEFSNTNDTADGNVWYLKDCDVIITTLSTSEGNALQYAYINKTFSKK